MKRMKIRLSLWVDSRRLVLLEEGVRRGINGLRRAKLNDGARHSYVRYVARIFMEWVLFGLGKGEG